MEHEGCESAVLREEPAAEYPMLARSVNELVTAGGRRWGEKRVLRGIGSGAGMTYAGLAEQHIGLTALLRRHGIRREDRVATLLGGGPEAVAAMLAISGVATYVPIGIQTHPLEIEALLRRLKVRAVVVSEETPTAARLTTTGVPLIELRRDRAGPTGRIELSFPKEMERFGGAEEDETGPEDLFGLLQTSGTTARSKIVPLVQGQLLGATSRNVGLLGLTARDRCLHVLAPVHMMGITTVLYTLMSGGELVLPRSFLPTAFFEWAREAEPTWITGPPAIHQGILRHCAGHEGWAREAGLRFVRSGAAPMRVSLIEEIERFWQAPVMEAYAMSECPLITSNRMGAGGRRLGSVGQACGVELALLNEAGKLEKAGAGRVGEIVIRGETVMGAYAEDAEAHAAEWVEGYFRTGDVGHLDEEGFLYLHGRAKEMINRGGMKIAPREVEEAVQKSSGVKEAAAFAIPDAHLGEEVGVAAVMQEGVEGNELELRKFVAARLSAHKVPARIVFVEEIPRGATGKIARMGMAEKLGITGASGASGARIEGDSRGFTAPRTELEQALSLIWQRVLGLKEAVGIDEAFLEIGGDSAQAAAMFLEVERLLGRELPLATLIGAPTVRMLAEAMGREGVERALGCLVGLRTECAEGRRPLFCFSGMLGHVLNFYPLARALGEGQAVYGLQMPEAAGQSFSRDVTVLAKKFLEEMRSVQREGPWQLLGYSYGGYVAYEVAQLLREAGEEVSFLGMLDTRSPACRKRALAAYVMAHRLKRWVGGIAGLRGKRTRVRGTRMTEEAKAMERESVKAVRGYQIKEYAGRIMVLRAAEQPWWVRWESCDWALGWDKYALQVEVKGIEGAHVTALETQRATGLAEVVRGCLLGQ